MDPERDRRSGRGSALKRGGLLRPPRLLRPTRAGWCFLAIVFGVGFAALNTGNNLLYLVLALMLAFLVLSGLLSEASLRGIRVERRLPREGFAEAPQRVVLRITNAQRRVPAFAISIEDQLDEGEPEPIAGRAFVLRVGAGETVERSYRFVARRRGDHAFSHVRISTRFPFGLFVKSAEQTLPGETLVFPALQPVTRPPAARADGETEALQGPTARGDDLAGLREFVPGDSLGRVHWRRSLRSRRLLVGERAGEASGEVEVLLQVVPGTPAAATEGRLSLASSEVVTHLAAGLRVGLRTPRARFPVATGPSHRRELLTYLARVPLAELQSARTDAADASDAEPPAVAGAKTGPANPAVAAAKTGPVNPAVARGPRA